MKIKIILLLISLFFLSFKVNDNEKSNYFQPNTVTIDNNCNYHFNDLSPITINSQIVENSYFESNLDNDKMCSFISTTFLSLTKDYIVEDVISTFEKTTNNKVYLITKTIELLKINTVINIYLLHSQNKLGFT